MVYEKRNLRNGICNLGLGENWKREVEINQMDFTQCIPSFIFRANKKAKTNTHSDKTKNIVPESRLYGKPTNPGCL
jgi:hypothetical protein